MYIVASGDWTTAVTALATAALAVFTMFLVVGVAIAAFQFLQDGRFNRALQTSYLLDQWNLDLLRRFRGLQHANLKPPYTAYDFEEGIGMTVVIMSLQHRGDKIDGVIGASDRLLSSQIQSLETPYSKIASIAPTWMLGHAGLPTHFLPMEVAIEQRISEATAVAIAGSE